jgi:hypothetical protein
MGDLVAWPSLNEFQATSQIVASFIRKASLMLKSSDDDRRGDPKFLGKSWNFGQPERR